MLLVALAMALSVGLPSRDALAGEVADAIARSEAEALEYLETHDADTLPIWSESRWNNVASQLTPQADEGFPAKFDLRDRGVVTPVKQQSPWGTCWAFGAIAASEISILSELGLTYEDMPLDLSERQIAWFSGTPLPNAETMAGIEAEEPYASQATEGVYPVSGPSRAMSTGGTPFYATTVFASGIGPLLEEEAPYRNDENIAIVKAREPVLSFQKGTALTPEQRESYNLFKEMDGEKVLSTAGRCVDVSTQEDTSLLDYYADYATFDEDGNYVGGGDSPYTWSLPEDKRFYLSLELEESTALPTPATPDSEGMYHYNEAGTNAIKSELMNGRGVHIEFCADTSQPGQESEGKYINLDTWSHYTFDDTGAGKVVPLNHDVCIVGWDDSWGTENFLQGTYTDPETGATVSRTPPGPGAWIVKNSWGAEGRGFPNDDKWGIVDENGKHTGYFYLSYYDMSIFRPMSYNFYTDQLDEEAEGIFVNQYDFMPSYDVSVLTAPECFMANVFTAEDDQLVRTLTVETEIPDTHVQLMLYRLSGDGANPDDGELLEAVEGTYAYGGYHRLQLQKKHFMAKGQRFSVVAQLWTENGDGNRTYYLPMHRALNLNFLENYPEGNLKVIAHGVINPGESFTFDEDGWVDWKETYEKISGMTPQDAFSTYFDYDNFALKAIGDEPAPLAVEKTVVDQQEVYHPGDTVKYRVVVRNDAKNPVSGVTVSDSLVDFGESGSIESLAVGEAVELEYGYTVTEDDAKAGQIVNEAAATIASIEGYKASASATVTCAQVEIPATPPKTAAPKRQSYPKTADAGVPFALAVALMACAGTAVATVAARRARRK